MPQKPGPGRRRDVTSRPSNDGSNWQRHRTTPGRQGGGPLPPDGCMVLVLGVLGVLGAAGTEIVRWLS